MAIRIPVRFILALDRGEIQGLCLSAETLLNMQGEALRSGAVAG